MWYTTLTKALHNDPSSLRELPPPTLCMQIVIYGVIKLRRSL